MMGILTTERVIQIGDAVVRRPITFSDNISFSREGARLLKGKVVYIHPKGRFHVVKFGEVQRAVRESFSGV